MKAEPVQAAEYMTSDQLRQLSSHDLNAYLWRRLRCESLDPPVSERFGSEPPEQFPMQAAKEDAEFHSRLVQVVGMHLDYFTIGQIVGRLVSPWDPVTDQQIASLAFMAATMDAKELYENLFRLGLDTFYAESDDVISDGQFHLLRSLAWLQSDDRLADFWKDLWHDGPHSIRGLTIYGWARSDAPAALEQLGELVDTDGIDLSTTVWNLATTPGSRAVIAAAEKLSPEQRDKLQQAMADSGMTERLP